MARLWVVGETASDGSVTKLSTEVATLGRSLAEAGGLEVQGIIFGDHAATAATELGRFLPSVTHEAGTWSADRSIVDVAGALSTRTTGDLVLLSASPDGRDVAGALSALTGMGVLVNATAVRWSEDGPVVEQSAFGGRLITESAFSDIGPGGIITVRPNSVAAEPLAAAGTVSAGDGSSGPDLPQVRIVDRVEEAAASASIEDARIIVSGGRGVGGAEGFKLVEALAEALGGAVGASRAAVDSGWIPYAQQIGQTGKIVKPQLYLALGISGAIQHKVGMQTAGSIVAVNRDPDAPIADFADVIVIGDLFEVGQALLDELQARTG